MMLADNLVIFPAATLAKPLRPVLAAAAEPAAVLASGKLDLEHGAVIGKGAPVELRRATGR